MGDCDVEIRAADWASEEARWCMAQYFDGLASRFEEGFDVQRGAPTDADDLTPPRGHLLLATRDDRPVGCVGVSLSGDWAEVKRMWVAPTARRLGLGRRLLAEAEQLAAANGAGVVRLDTNSALPEAIALYRSAGYEEIARYNDNPYAHHWFEKRLG